MRVFCCSYLFHAWVTRLNCYNLNSDRRYILCLFFENFFYRTVQTLLAHWLKASIGYEGTNNRNGAVLRHTTRGAFHDFCPRGLRRRLWQYMYISYMVLCRWNLLFHCLWWLSFTFFCAVWDSWMPWRPQEDPWGCWRGIKLCYWVDLPTCYSASSHQEYWKVYWINFLPWNYYLTLHSIMAIWEKTTFNQSIYPEGENWKWRLYIGSCLLSITLYSGKISMGAYCMCSEIPNLFQTKICDWNCFYSFFSSSRDQR